MGVSFVSVHDITDVLKELLMSGLVIFELIIPMIPHKLLFERKMRRDTAEYLA